MKLTISLACLVLAGVLSLGLPGTQGSLLKAAAAREPITTHAYVTTKNGTMKGYLARAVNNNTIYSFMKIPFAKPPVGNLRFKNPEPTDGWGTKVLDATQLIPSCPQAFSGVVPFAEDCLYLAVYSSRSGNETDREPAPVMVWMFGGAFVLGESSYYTGHRLLANDVILVVPNYRVSVLGFLATGDEASPGNYGLKDQNMALRWVQENIAAFGGDPNKVTIFGESAGGSSVIYHLLSPKSHGLFHRVIAQSGTAITPWSKDKHPRKSADRVAKVMNCPTTTSQELVDCMRTKSAFNLTLGYFSLMVDDLSHSNMRLEGTNPVIEPDLPGAFITEDPYALLKAGNYPDVPVLIGATAEEGSLFLAGFHFLDFGNPDKVDKTLNNPAWLREDMVDHVLTQLQLREHSGSAALEETIALTFMPNENRLDFSRVSSALVDMMSVFGIKGPVLKTAEILSQHMTSVYLYSFEHRTTDRHNSLWYYVFDIFVPILGGEVPPYDHGIIHADDLIYEFNLPFILNEEDLKFSSLFCELWTNFAASGNPTPEASERYPLWPKYHWRDPQYYVLNGTPAIAKDYRQQWLQ